MKPMIGLFSPSQAAQLARCHRRSALIDTTETLRDAANASDKLSAAPARLLDSPCNTATECVLTHNGVRYRLTVRQEDDGA